MVGACHHERLGSHKDHLNGMYLRRCLASIGSIELAVPRRRRTALPSHVVGRYNRRTDDMDRLMTTAQVQGVSKGYDVSMCPHLSSSPGTSR